MLGTVYKMQPQPLEPADTRWVEAGALRFGIEYREVNPDALAATYGADPNAMAEMHEHEPEGGYTDVGVSIHVVASEDGHEYLRFDVFDGDPHYHYVAPSGDHNHVIGYDPVANGDMLTWVIGRLRTRLAEMLAQAGGAALTGRLDAAALSPVIDRLAVMAEKAQREQRTAGRR